MNARGVLRDGRVRHHHGFILRAVDTGAGDVAAWRHSANDDLLITVFVLIQVAEPRHCAHKSVQGPTLCSV